MAWSGSTPKVTGRTGSETATPTASQRSADPDELLGMNTKHNVTERLPVIWRQSFQSTLPITRRRYPRNTASLAVTQPLPVL